MGVGVVSLRKSMPGGLQRAGRTAYVAAGARTAAVRLEPDFIMIGGQRCGTTSLFRALMDHPQVVRPTFHKGVNYFDVNYDQSPEWYRGHFPLAALAKRKTRSFGPPVVFEASGYYMYHPFAIERIAQDLPQVKLVVMLRDPVERAYSAYQHELKRGYEWETFERALDLEDERLVGEVERMRADVKYESFTHRHHSYTRRGHYAEQLEEVLRHFPREQLHVMESETFFERPEVEYDKLIAFLGAKPFQPAKFDRYNAQPRSPMADPTRARLEAHFAPHDEKLAALLQHSPHWSKNAG
jgi:hypothetical protein